MKTKRAISVSDFENFNPRLVPFEGVWEKLLGKPELKGTWLCWGESGMGKTRFALQLAKYMANFTRVAYNSLEEGLSASLKLAIDATDFREQKRRVIFLDQEPLPEMLKRVKKAKSPQIYIVDSSQYTGINYKEYLQEVRPVFSHNKQLILLSHAHGKQPSGRTARSIKYDAFVKIRIEGFRAFALSRYGGNNSYYDIWDEGAAEYWGEKTEKQLV